MSTGWMKIMLIFAFHLISVWLVVFVDKIMLMEKSTYVRKSLNIEYSVIDISNLSKVEVFEATVIHAVASSLLVALIYRNPSSN